MYNQTIEKTLADLKTSRLGLTSHEAEKRQIKFGLNEFREGKKTALWSLFLSQFKDFMILILIAVAILLGFLGDRIDTIIILVIVILNATVGFFQEYQAEKAIALLKKMAIAQATVLRNKNLVMMSSTVLVPGDIVIIEAGNVVPADLRLLETHGLRVDESSLTGESFNPIFIF
jgi:Ca2+-transporting ATPase